MSVAREEALALIASRVWFHRFDLLPGVTTPGLYRVQADEWLEETIAPAAIAGRRFLEIGTWDGPYAFALERRGAIVEATDIQDPDETGFNIAKRILGSRVNYTRTSVYEVESHFEGESFDAILFLGVFYHLKHPVRAFEALAGVLKKGGRLYFEGECLASYGPRADGREPRWLHRLMLARLGAAGFPLSLYYADRFKDDASNWHVPNVACLDQWLKTAGLEMESHRCVHAGRGAGRFPTQRIAGVAVKNASIREEHPLVQHIGDELRRAAAAPVARSPSLRRLASGAIDGALGTFGLRRNGFGVSRAHR